MIIVECKDVEWVEIDCNKYDDYIEKIGYRSNADDDDRLTVYATYTDSEGKDRSLTVWGNERVGIVLRWTGYLGRGDRGEIECKHWVARHASSYYANKIQDALL